MLVMKHAYATTVEVIDGDEVLIRQTVMGEVQTVYLTPPQARTLVSWLQSHLAVDADEFTGDDE